jgi:hypothetical protein
VRGEPRVKKRLVLYGALLCSPCKTNLPLFHDVMDEEFEIVDQDEVIQSPYIEDMREWVGLASKYVKMTSTLTGIIYENYSNASAYRANKNKIKNEIFWCLDAEKIAIVLETQPFVAESTRHTPI